MTATNHALTGSLVALIVKKPELAIPLALLSHFALDLVPHYNPRGLTRDKFANYRTAWSQKMKDKSFRVIFPIDMVLFLAVLLIMPLVSPSSVSAWTVFFSAAAGAAPDFIGGLKYLAFLVFRIKTKDNDWLTRFHIGLQWMERPWGIYVEFVWAVLMLLFIRIQIK